MSDMEYVRFGELYKIPSCNGLSRPRAVRGEGYKMVNMGELFSNDIINDMYMERVQMNEREQKKFLLEKGDLLFARQSLVATGAGKCSVVNNLAEKTTFESHLIRVRLDETKANPLYYYYLFQLPYNPVKTIVNQCAQAGIRGTELVRIKVPLLNIEYQNTIANALFQYDKLIENNNKRIKLLEQIAENLYKEWFVRFRFPGYEEVKFENGIPNEWEIKRLFEFGKIETGKTPSKERDQNYGGDIMFIKTPDMHDNIYVISTNEFLSTEGHLTQPKKLLPENSIMVSCIGTGGVVAINDKPAHTNQQINSIILNKSEYLEWLYFVCKNLKETIEMFGATGSTMTNLSKGKFEKLKIVSPSEKVILEYHELTKNLFIEVRVLLHKNDLLAKQRDLLLPRLMSGKLEV